MKTTITVLALLFSSIIYSQSGVSLSLHQDVKLGILGDPEHGYKAGTLDLLARFKMNGNQMKYGFFTLFGEYEYAEIDGLYKRYSVNTAYTFNKLIVDDFEVNVAIGWGWIDRYGKSMFSFGASSELAYKLNDHFKLSLLGQLTERKDLKFYYGEKQTIRPSVFLGIEYKL